MCVVEARCPSPDLPPNVYTTSLGGSARANTSRDFFCREGHLLTDGDTVRTCQEDSEATVITCDCDIQYSGTSAYYRLFPDIGSKYLNPHRTSNASKLSLLLLSTVFICILYSSLFCVHSFPFPSLSGCPYRARQGCGCAREGHG